MEDRDDLDLQNSPRGIREGLDVPIDYLNNPAMNSEFQNTNYNPQSALQDMNRFVKT